MVEQRGDRRGAGEGPEPPPGAMALGLEDTGARMSRLGHSQIVHGRVLTLDEIEARLAALDLDHVNEVGARWLSGPRTLACVGPFDADGEAAP